MTQEGFPTHDPEDDFDPNHDPSTTPEVDIHASWDVERVHNALLVEMFTGSEIYSPEGPATTYARERIAILCGDEYKVPEVLVCVGDDINGKATAETLAIDAGTFQALDSAEELDASLAHELVHILKGHSCQRQDVSDDMQSLAGAARIAEIEADLEGMQLLDKRGINPLGMLHLMDKLARAEQEESTQGTFRLHSIAHGAAVERKVTVEQFLNVMDGKHLSAHMTPLPSFSAEPALTPDEENPAFRQLPAPVQQGLLNTVSDRYTFKKSAAIQKAILQAAREQNGDFTVEDAETEQRKVEFLRDMNATLPLELETPVDVARLQHGLELLYAPEITLLMDRSDIDLRGERLLRASMRSAIVNENNTLEDVKAITDLYDQWAKNVQTKVRIASRTLSIPFIAVADEKLLSVLSSNPRQDAIKKIAWFGEALIHSYDDLHLLLTCGKNMDAKTHNTVLTTLTTQIVDQIDKYRVEKAEQQQTLIDRIAFVASRMPDKSLEDHMIWGTGRVTYNYHTTIESNTFAYKLHKEVAAADYDDLYKLLVALSNRGEKPSTIRYAASFILTKKSGGERYAISLPEADDNEGLSHVLWLRTLPIAILELAPIDSDNITDRFGDLCKHILSDAFQDHNRMSLGRKVDRQLHQLAAAEQVIATIREAIPSWSVTIETVIEENATLRELLFYDAVRSFNQKIPDASKLIALLQSYDIPRLETGTIYETHVELAKVQDMWSRAVESLLSKPGWDTNESNLLCLAALGIGAPEIELNLTVANYAFARIARLRDLSGGIQLLDGYSHIPTVQATIFNILIEEKARTAEDFERLNKIAGSLYTTTIKNNLKMIGQASFIDAIALPLYSSHETSERKVGLKSDTIRGLESSRLLGTLLSSGQNDEPLKRYVAERWWISKRSAYETEFGEAEAFKVEDYVFLRQPAKRARLEHWLTHDYPHAEAYKPFDNSMSDVYLLTSPARFFAVRKLLLGQEDGVLKDEAGAGRLVDALMQSWLSAEVDTDEGVMLRDLLMDLIVQNDPAMAYLHISPMIQEMILKPPKQPSDLSLTTRYISDNITETLIKSGKLKNPTNFDYESIRRRTHQLFTGRSGSKSTFTSVGAIKERLLNAIGVVDSESGSGKLSTVAFSALAGRKSGALGIKMLQLAGQYFDLSKEDRAEFEGIYDDMKGQTRLQAYNVLKREAETNPVIANLLGSIKEFGSRVGGGSLFTVYKALLVNDQEIVIGVKNPNAGYRVARLAEFTTTGLAKTAETHHTNTNLQLISSLLDDAATWVHNELDDPDFHRKDTVFRTENDTVAGQGFKKGKARYELTTPDSLHTGSQWIRSEAFVGGKNLTGLRVVDGEPTDINKGVIEREDYKHAASLLVRNYVYQVMQGSYAHSDIHPGNFRINSDNTELVIFDRHNLIPMDPKLRQTLKSSFEGIISGDVQGAALTIAAHATQDSSILERVQEKIEHITATSDNPATLVTDMILTLKREGVSVPLDLSLLLRNFMSVAQFSSQAGFSHVGEAFLYTASGIEELQQLA